MICFSPVVGGIRLHDVAARIDTDHCTLAQAERMLHDLNQLGLDTDPDCGQAVIDYDGDVLFEGLTEAQYSDVVAWLQGQPLITVSRHDVRVLRGGCND